MKMESLKSSNEKQIVIPNLFRNLLKKTLKQVQGDGFVFEFSRHAEFISASLPIKPLKRVQHNCSKGFTLAEILIALTVIGVISAVTVPVLMQNTNKQETVTALKKTYSTLSQVTNQIIAEEGSPASIGNEKGWAEDAVSIYNQYKTRLSSAKDCGNNSGCFNQLKAGQKGYKYLSGNGYYTLDWNTNDSFPNLILQDGVQVSFLSASKYCTAIWDSVKHCARIHVDLNGVKTPNQLGRDVFMFLLTENGLVPAGCNSDCRQTKDGWSCACKVLREDAMNY